MFRDNWFLFALVTTLLGLATGQEALLFMAALLVTVVPVVRLWNRWSLRGLRYTRAFGENRAFVGEEIPLTLELTNEKPLPLLWVRVDDRFPDNMPPEGRDLFPSGLPRIGLLSHVAALLWYEKVRWHYVVPCRQRGYYFFGPVQLRSGDIFGILESETVVAGTTRLIVYPRIEPLERFGLPAKDPFGGKRTRVPIFEDPTVVTGVRDYHPDDPMRRVHWKASARTQGLQVRVWEPTQEHQVIVMLNVSTFEKHWQGVNRELLEWTISIAASICQHTFNDRNAVGLFANASVPQSDQPVKVAPGRSPHQMRLLLEALAAITNFATMPLERLLRVESYNMGWGATIVIVSAVVSEALQAEMIRLRRAGRQIALVSLDNSFSEADAAALQLHNIIVYRLEHNLGVRENRLGGIPSDEGIASWMLPEDYDPHAAYRPPESRNGGQG